MYLVLSEMMPINMKLLLAQVWALGLQQLINDPNQWVCVSPAAGEAPFLGFPRQEVITTEAEHDDPSSSSQEEMPSSFQEELLALPGLCCKDRSRMMAEADMTQSLRSAFP